MGCGGGFILFRDLRPIAYDSDGQSLESARSHHSRAIVAILSSRASPHQVVYRADKFQMNPFSFLFFPLPTGT